MRLAGIILETGSGTNYTQFGQLYSCVNSTTAIVLVTLVIIYKKEQWKRNHGYEENEKCTHI